MISSVSNSAMFSAAMLSGSQCRGSCDTEALKEKLFTKLDANGDGGIDKSELGDFISSAASRAGSGTADSAELFSSMDCDGDGAITSSELSEGVKSLFDELRMQLMTGAGKATEQEVVDEPDAEDLFARIDTNGDGSVDQSELGSFLEASGAARPQPEASPEGRQDFRKIERLLDQYRSTANPDVVG